MSFITKRVIAMGYPSTGCESIYRNSLADVKRFFARYQPDYKVYNLCIEFGRIYDKKLFNVTGENGDIVQKKVALFGFLDHQPCPIKLTLQIMVDLCLFLIRNPQAVATLHCKAGKGRTGMIIVNYLIFSGLCRTVDQAIEHYARQRTKNNKGVTIASQRRYIEYFVDFCNSHFTWPYYKCIPLIKYKFLTDSIFNILRDYVNQSDYFYTLNFFHIKSVKIGPFKKYTDCKVDFGGVNTKKIGFAKLPKNIEQEDNGYYIIVNTISSPSVNFDVKLNVTTSGFKFYCWFNLYYAVLQNLSDHIASILNLSKSNANSVSPSNNISIINLEKILSDKQDLNASNFPQSNPRASTASQPFKNTDLLDGEEMINTSSKTNLISEEMNSDKLPTNADTEERVTIDKSISPELKVCLRNTLKNMNTFFKGTQNLLPVIKIFNDDARGLQIPIFDIANQKLVLSWKQLDKPKDKFGLIKKEDFRVIFDYELQDKRKTLTIFG